MPAPKYDRVRASLAAMWRDMSIRQYRLGVVDAAAKKIVANKARYVPISEKTGVPWPMIGVLHLRESDCNFSKHLHNGDPLTGRTRRVPAGRPLKGSPPYAFVESAVDALEMKGWTNSQEWPIERVLFEAERFNGFGYRGKGKPNSPYVWGATNHYTRGKYVRDGVYSATHVDQQLGVASVLKRIMELDRGHGLYLTNEKKTVVETVSQSKSLPTLIVGFLVWLGTQVSDAIQSSWDISVWAISSLPALVMGAQEQIGASQTLATWLSVDWASVGKYATAAVMLLVFWRELQRKRLTP